MNNVIVLIFNLFPRTNSAGSCFQPLNQLKRLFGFGGFLEVASSLVELYRIGGGTAILA